MKNKRRNLGYFFIVSWFTFFLLTQVNCATFSYGSVSQNKIFKAKEKVIPALVHLNPIKPVYTLGKKEEVIVIGSGFIISSDGYVITNEHVVGESKKVKCILSDKREVDADVIGTDPFTDIAVLKLPADEKYPYVVLGNSDKIDVGGIVFAMGSPHGLARSVSMGIISMTDRYLEDQRGVISMFNNFIQTDAAINQGNSGGPLVNLKGEVIGINSRMLIGAENVGFAIPINIAKEVVDSIIKTGKVQRGWVGINLQEMKAITEDMNQKGVVISDVEVDSPAYKAGIQSGDILVAVNNESIHARFQEDLPLVRKKLADLEPGKEAQLTVMRNGETKDFHLIPEVYSPYKGQEVEFTEWGFTASEITNEMLKRLRIPNRNGIYISGVQDGSIAKNSGLLAGDVILEFEKQPVNNLEQFLKLYQDAIETNKQKILLFVQRGVVTRFILIKDMKVDGLTIKGIEEKRRNSDEH
ncbi:MAG TPA: trypsin-like peptidase domain-containing protein [Candidatus Hydrogenedens sp.]|nr:trypsin-like peptidase domain-containing protein [Candidatus Hydrogenedens sp.]